MDGKPKGAVESCGVGVTAARGMTNCGATILFVVCWAAMVVLAGVAIGGGDVRRIIYGSDYLGNVCSHGRPEGVVDDVAGSWGSRALVWYPVQYDDRSGSFGVHEALQLGVCVARCPALGDASLPYGTGTESGNLARWRPMFNSAPTLHRCVANLSSYACGADLGCLKAAREAGSAAALASRADVAAREVIVALSRWWWTVVVCAVLALVLSGLWLVLMRQVIIPVVVLTIVTVASGMGVGGYLLLRSHLHHRQSTTTYLVGAIVVWVVDFVFLCAVLYLRKDIIRACGIVVEASRVPTEMPSMLLVPPGLVALVVPVVVFGLFVAGAVYAASPHKSVSVPAVAGVISARQYTFEDWQRFGQAYNLFMILWTLSLLHALGLMLASFCAVFWYWSCPGERKSTNHGVWTALSLTLRYHFGTVALGSLIVAIIGMLRVVMRVVEGRLRRLSRGADTVRFVMNCANCCLACFDRIVRYVNRNAYVVCCMTGESFLPSARHALALLVNNIGTAAAVTVVGDVVMVLGKILVTVLVSVVALGLTMGGVAETQDGTVVVVVVCAALAYVIASIFINVFGVCIDTLLLSYCLDLERNNGMDRPYFYPRGIAQHVEAAQSQAEAAEAAPLSVPVVSRPGV